MSKLYDLKAAEAEISCTARMTAFSVDELSHKRRTWGAIVLGACIGFSLVDLQHSALPGWLPVTFLGIAVPIYLFHLGRSLFAKGKLEIWADKTETLSFRVNENQIIWLFTLPNKVYVEIPIFKSKFSVLQADENGVKQYTCTGKASTLFLWAMRNTYRHEAKDCIYKLGTVQINVTADPDKYPEAVAVLDALSQKG